MGDITNLRDKANTYNEVDYRRAVEEETKRQIELKARKKEKVRLQNKAKRDTKIRRWKAVGLTILMGLGTTVCYGISQIPDFKSKIAEESLNKVKTSIAESVDRPVGSVQVYNNSTKLSSNSAKTEYEVVIDNETFYFRSENDGTTTKEIQDDIKNNDVLKAISDVSNAQHGNIVESLRAKKTVEKIESGEMNLDMSEAMQAKGFEIDD